MHTSYDHMIVESGAPKSHPPRVPRIVDGDNETPVSVPEGGHWVTIPLWLI